MTTLPESIGRELKELFPTAYSRVDGEAFALRSMLDAEWARRGKPDATGAFHALALREGSLLKEEYDLGSHGHSGWRMGALLVDPVELMLVNQRHDFETGDRVLVSMVAALYRVCPTAKVVRIHSDGFAVLLGPTADQPVSPSLLPLAAEELTRAVAPHLGAELLRFTLGLLELEIKNPSHWQVLGPLVWAECERSLTFFKRHAASSEVLHRKIDLEGAL